MTKKRYQKLLYALMQKLNQDHIKHCGESAKGWGKVLKAVQKVEHKNFDKTKVNSYAEAWEALKSLREANGM